jgi:hypothetical protein
MLQMLIMEFLDVFLSTAINEKRTHEKYHEDNGRDEPKLVRKFHLQTNEGNIWPKKLYKIQSLQMGRSIQAWRNIHSGS